jgi:transposase-like protein
VRSLEKEVEARAVAEYREGGVTYRELAERYGVSESAVKRAVYRVTKGADYLKRGKV